MKMNLKGTLLRRVGYAASALATGVVVVALMSAGPESTPALEAYADGALRYMPNTAYGFDEKLQFDVGYKFITAGTAVMQIGSGPVAVSGRNCYDVRFDVRTTSAFDKVFKVRDRYQTYIDIDGIFPWRFEQSVREGNYSRDFSAIVDQRANVAKTTEGSFKVPAFVHDILSAFYYTRALDLHSLKKGQSFTLKNFYGKNTYDLRIRILGREQVEVDAGTFDCIVVEPLVVEGGLFKNEGRIVVYLTDDDRKIPVKVSTKVVIGSIDGELTGYSGTRGPIAAKRN
ncbi:MAG: DUF3108 domain-containing protein [Bacteroidetes bacterium]|nr:DUF3108 domain-containing protein [Bacteroidota bacterium]